MFCRKEGLSTPKLKENPQELADRKIKSNIAYLAEYKDLSPNELAASARVSIAAWYERMNKPDMFRLKELRGIAKLCNVTIPQLIGEEPLQNNS